MNLDGGVSLVTGAARRLGKRIAVALARRGSRSTPISGNIGDVWGRMKAWFSGQF